MADADDLQARMMEKRSAERVRDVMYYLADLRRNFANL